MNESPAGDNREHIKGKMAKWLYKLTEITSHIVCSHCRVRTMDNVYLVGHANLFVQNRSGNLLF